MVDPTATHPVTGAKSTISTSGQPAHPTTGWSETAGAQRSSPTAKPQGSRHPTSTAVPTPNNYALTAATAPTTYLGFNDPRRQQRRCSCETQQYQDSCSQTDRFPEGGGDALSGLATILDRNPRPVPTRHDRFAEAVGRGVLPAKPETRRLEYVDRRVWRSANRYDDVRARHCSS